MAITYGIPSISCLSTDTKPTNVPVGTVCYETDTDDAYVFDSAAAWTRTLLPVLRAPVTSVVLNADECLYVQDYYDVGEPSTTEIAATAVLEIAETIGMPDLDLL